MMSVPNEDMWEEISFDAKKVFGMSRGGISTGIRRQSSKE